MSQGTDSWSAPYRRAQIHPRVEPGELAKIEESSTQCVEISDEPLPIDPNAATRMNVPIKRKTPNDQNEISGQIGTPIFSAKAAQYFFQPYVFKGRSGEADLGDGLGHQSIFLGSLSRPATAQRLLPTGRPRVATSNDSAAELVYRTCFFWNRG